MILEINDLNQPPTHCEHDYGCSKFIFRTGCTCMILFVIYYGTIIIHIYRTT